jgi:hypothetical protein
VRFRVKILSEWRLLFAQRNSSTRLRLAQRGFAIEMFPRKNVAGTFNYTIFQILFQVNNVYYGRFLFDLFNGSRIFFV